jgi:desulfoferrodoxin (superoxide reductase-like protein)
MSAKTSLLILIILFTLTIPTVTVYADVPTVLSITRRTVSSNTIIDVTVRHAGPSVNHYVNQVSLDLDGTIKVFADLPKPTEVQTTFTLNIGSATPNTISAQAVCNIHGPSPWFKEGTATTSPSGGIPGYPLEAIAAGIFIATTLVLGKRR